MENTPFNERNLMARIELLEKHVASLTNEEKFKEINEKIGEYTRAVDGLKDQFNKLNGSHRELNGKVSQFPNFWMFQTSNAGFILAVTAFVSTVFSIALNYALNK